MSMFTQLCKQEVLTYLKELDGFEFSRTVVPLKSEYVCLLTFTFRSSENDGIKVHLHIIIA